MFKNSARYAGVSLICSTLFTPLISAQSFPVDVVEALEHKFSVHPGQRRNHTKGLCFAGSFVGNSEATKVSSSALFSGGVIKVIGRFSHAGGNPDAADNQINAHGMALKFMLPEGEIHQMAMLNLPFFAVKTPQVFLANLLASMADPATGKPDPNKLAEFEKKFPEVLKLKQALKGQDRVPKGYEHEQFNSIHTFFGQNAARQETAIRWSFVPDASVQKISNGKLAEYASNFLQEDLITTLAKHSISWQMQITLANKADELNDPTSLWQGEHKIINGGQLTINSLEAPCENINFDPMVLSKGIKASDDPVLHARSGAYAVSFGRRLGEQPKQTN
jgi:catalase